MINWRTVQNHLTGYGYAPGSIDGIAGPRTYSELFAFAAGRQPDHTIMDIGAEASTILTSYGLDASPQRLAEFIAQTANETGGYRVFVENLNYSAAAICRCWPGRFPTLADAAAYAHNPMALANKTYGDRMGNTQTGDGARFIGRGMLQLTGRANYKLFGDALGFDLIADPDRAADPAISLHIACEFWKRGNVNAAVDAGNFAKARRITNGGTIGLQSVAARRAQMLGILA